MPVLNLINNTLIVFFTCCILLNPFFSFACHIVETMQHFVNFSQSTLQLKTNFNIFSNLETCKNNNKERETIEGHSSPHKKRTSKVLYFLKHYDVRKVTTNKK